MFAESNCAINSGTRLRRSPLSSLGCLVTVLCGFVACIPCFAWANTGPLQFSSGTVFPKKELSSIRMVSEEVIIRLSRASYTVDAVFVFFNSGETTTELVGFPIEGPRDWLVRFDSRVEGRKVVLLEHKEKPAQRKGEMLTRTIERVFSPWFPGLSDHGHQVTDIGERRWMTQVVTFPTNSRTTIQVIYESRYFPGGVVPYILGTGSYWNGDIGRAIFLIDCTDLGGTNAITVDFRNLATLPGPQLLGGNLLKIEMRHIKPPEEAMLVIRPKIRPR